MDGYICFDTFLVLAQELGNSFNFRFRFREGTAVGVITGMRGGTLFWGRKGGKAGLLITPCDQDFLYILDTIQLQN